MVAPYLLMIIISLHFNGHFPGEPGLAGTKMTPFWTLLKQDEGGGGNNWSYKTGKAPVINVTMKNQHPVFTGRMPFLLPKQQCQSTEEKIYGTYEVEHLVLTHPRCPKMTVLTVWVRF